MQNELEKITKEGLSTCVEPLIQWYRQNGRSLPWREAPSPYHVWISEIMLQQTRIEAVMEYYKRFIERLPEVSDLAGISEDDLLKLWEGLGYYTRARNLKKAAVQIMEEYGGELPDDYDLLIRLPGIGNYTAGAIASIAYGLPEPAVDGNVLRVVMRFLDCEADVMSQKVRRKTEDVLRQVMRERFKPCSADAEHGSGEISLHIRSEGGKSGRAGEFTQAIMELGEVICIPSGKPHCESCPLQDLCLGYSTGHEDTLPVRRAKTARRIEKRTVLRIRDEEGRIAIRRREDKGLLAGLWELPSVEGHLEAEDAMRILSSSVLPRPMESDDVFSCNPVTSLGPARHIFSHVEWHMVGYEVRVSSYHMLGLTWAAPEDFSEKFALPRAFQAYMIQ